MAALLDRKLVAHFDWGLFVIALCIPCSGLIVLYSAGYDPETVAMSINLLDIEFHSLPFVKQATFVMGGILAIGFALLISPNMLHRLAYPIYGLSVAFLVAVLLVGIEAKGGRRWLGMSGFSFQPSEVMKLAMILCLAKFLSRHPPRPGGYGISALIVPFLVLAVPVALIIKQPDLGTSLAILGVGSAMILFMGVRPKTLLLLLIGGIVAVVVGWNFVMHPYQKQRVMVLLNPEADRLGSGYHIIQSKIAVGSGSFFGKGFLNGTQTQLEFLPEHTTDFIFSVLAEEWGFAGCILVLSLYAYLVYRLMRVVVRSKDLFSALVVFGIAAQIFLNAIINIGMVIGLLPVVGLPLPLFSYGGTSLISTLFALGLALGISMRRLSYLVGS